VGKYKITAIKALTLKDGITLVKIETDSGITGYGPCGGTGGGSGPTAREFISALHTTRLPHLGLIGKDPLAIQVHFHNMFYAYPQRWRATRIFSGIDVALWDLAGKILGLPVSRLLGGPFRDQIPLYSHAGSKDPFSKDAWRASADTIRADPRGFKAFKVDIHSPLGWSMQQYSPSIGPQEVKKVERFYSLAREAFGPDIDIIVHCHSELDLPTAIRVAQVIEPIKPLFFEDPLTPAFSDSWMALRRSTRLPLMTGEVLELLDGAMPFLQNQAVDCLQPDLRYCGGISGANMIADLAAMYRIPICLHNVNGYALNLASQQWSAAHFNCPMMECRRDAWQAPEAAANVPVIKDGKMAVSSAPGLGIEFNQEYLKANRAPGEPWWG
jgi:galactonate dehydratase